MPHRAEELLELAETASQRLVEGLACPANLKMREQSRHLFVFVILSVLLEDRKQHLAQELKEAFALQQLGARKILKSLSQKALPAAKDPFVPYYDSFQKMRQNPEQGPFAILARRLSEEHFEAPLRQSAYEKIFTLAAALSDELIERL